jgi:hypothetical protein
MSSQKPTKSPTRRVALPKSPAFEHTTQVQRAAYRALPTDITSLAHILEAAMNPGRQASNFQQPTSNFQQPTANFQQLTASADTPDIDEAATSLAAIPHRRRTDDAPAAPEPTARIGDATQPEAAAFDEVARSLGAAEACVPLLAQATGLLRIAALDVVRAETARAGGLLQLLRFLRGDLTPAVTAVSTSAVLHRVVQAVESERRLRSVSLTARSSVGDATIAGDETLLANTLLALLLTTFAVLEGVQNPRVMLSITVSDSGEIGLAVGQDHLAAPATWLARAGSDELTTEVNQAVTGIALSAAHRLVRHWGGRFVIGTGEHSSVLTLWLPMLHTDDAEQIPH